MCSEDNSGDEKCVFLGSYFSSAYFGQGTIPIMMDFVNCSGSELRLWDCNHFTHSYGCTHSDDVGIRCQPGLLFQLDMTIYQLEIKLNINK